MSRKGEGSVSPESIDSIVLTHAHVDHTGLLPRILREGFRGRIFATHRTTQLCEIILPACGLPSPGAPHERRPQTLLPHPERPPWLYPIGAV